MKFHVPCMSLPSPLSLFLARAILPPARPLQRAMMARKKNLNIVQKIWSTRQLQ
jgi:hypothetical protein